MKEVNPSILLSHSDPVQAADGNENQQRKEVQRRAKVLASERQEHHQQLHYHPSCLLIVPEWGSKRAKDFFQEEGFVNNRFFLCLVRG